MDDGGASEACISTRMVLGSISDKWMILVLGLLATHTMRFGELRRSIPGISHKVLTQTLRRAERDGLICRTELSALPLKVEYELSELGLSLTEALASLRNWATFNAQRVREAQERYAQAT